MNTVHVMSSVLRIVIKYGYDVICSAYDGIHMPPVMSHIVGVMFLTDRMGVMTYTVDVMANRMGFKSDIELVLSHTQCV